MSSHFKPSPIPPTTELQSLPTCSFPTPKSVSLPRKPRISTPRAPPPQFLIHPDPVIQRSSFRTRNCSFPALLVQEHTEISPFPTEISGFPPLHASLRSLIQTAAGKLRFFRPGAAVSRSEAHASVAMEAALPLRRRPPRQEPPAPRRRGRLARWPRQQQPP